MFHTYRHLHDPHAHHWAGGSCTFSIEVYEEEQMMSVGVAICSPKDNFCKATGRCKADYGDGLWLGYTKRLTLLENIFYELRVIATKPKHYSPCSGHRDKWMKAFTLLYSYSLYQDGLNDFGKARS